MEAPAAHAGEAPAQTQPPSQHCSPSMLQRTLFTNSAGSLPVGQHRNRLALLYRAPPEARK